MSAVERYEILVLGGGEAGKYIAWELARPGRRTAVIERALIGGSCPNIACMPSKNVIRSAKVADFFSHAAEYGLDRKSTRLNSSHANISYAVFCLKKKKTRFSPTIPASFFPTPD